MLIKKIRRIPSKFNEIISQYSRELYAWWINSIIRRPVWYTDQFGITSQLRPNENIEHVLATKSHFDDLGLIALLSNLLKPGMTIFDVGANKGDFALHVAKLIQQNGYIHAFEPVKYAYDYFSENIAHSPRISKNIKLNRFAVYKQDGEVEINIFPPELSGWNTIGFPRMSTINGDIMPTQSERVEAITLDTYCEKFQIPVIDLLKIDVEGFEPEVIEGAKRLLAENRIRNIIFEISLAPLQGAGRTGLEVLNIFMNSNLAVHLIKSDGTLERITDVEYFTIPFFANYFAIPIDQLKTSAL